MFTITKHIEIKWMIIGFDGYGFGSDKVLYNLKTGRKVKQAMNCCSIGFWFNKKFVTTTKIKTLLYRPPKEYCPF